MKIAMEIPDEFAEHFNSDKFSETFKRISFDIENSLKNDGDLLSGNYEKEVIDMLEKAFKKSKTMSGLENPPRERMAKENNLLEKRLNKKEKEEPSFPKQILAEEIKINKDYEGIYNSILIPEDTIVAEYKDKNNRFSIFVKVNGASEVWFKDTNKRYICCEDFPKELKDILRNSEPYNEPDCVEVDCRNNFNLVIKVKTKEDTTQNTNWTNYQKKIYTIDLPHRTGYSFEENITELFNGFLSDAEEWYKKQVYEIEVSEKKIDPYTIECQESEIKM